MPIMRQTKATAPFIAAVTAALCLLQPAVAQDAPVRGTKVVPDRPARVFVMAAFDNACRQVAAAAITIDKPPAKGQVSLRENQPTTVMYSLSGKCIGTKLTGTGIYYTAAKGASGADTFTVSAKLSSGEIATRTFNVVIADD